MKYDVQRWEGFGLGLLYDWKYRTVYMQILHWSIAIGKLSR